VEDILCFVWGDLWWWGCWASIFIAIFDGDKDRWKELRFSQISSSLPKTKKAQRFFSYIFFE
jgi:hypothetical protein